MTATTTRRHDIDARRALAFALLIPYHWCMLYVAGDDWDWHVKSTYLAEWLQLPMLRIGLGAAGSAREVRIFMPKHSDCQ